MNVYQRFLLLVVWITINTAAFAADWPTWRCDPQRTGATGDNLPDDPELLWEIRLDPIRQAWPFDSRMAFDASYEPVAAGGVMLVASPNDDSVTAFNTTNGGILWKFFAEAPVRHAPTIDGNQALVGSDDGYLYCLDVKTGKVLWKFHGAVDRPTRRLLGNGRLISRWPVRGGAVVDSGRVYFACGMWPTEGVFIHCLDAKTGRVIWTNDKTGLISDVRIDHNKLADAGLAPQGYLAISGDRLLVPNGRSMPAALDTRTGELLWYVQGYRHGDWKIAASPKYVLVGDEGVLDMETGREAGSRWHEREAADNSRRGGPEHFEGPISRYKFVPGCGANSALQGNMVFSFTDGAFYAYNLAAPKMSLYDEKVWGQDVKVGRWDPLEQWKLETPLPKSGGDGLVVSTPRQLIGVAGPSVVAINSPVEDHAASIAWTRDVGGKATSLLVADSKLFVVTEEGRILCFGAGEPPTAAATTAPSPIEPTAAAVSRAKSLLQASAARPGSYCVVLGLADGSLIDAMLTVSDLKIIAIDADETRIDGLRRRYAQAGFYGQRVHLLAAEPDTKSLPPLMADMVVSESLDAAALVEKFPAGDLYRLLRPYGGALCLEAAAVEATTTWAAADSLESAELQVADGSGVLRRKGALPGSDEWTHESGNAQRTYYSRDTLARTPLGILWWGEGHDYGFYTPRGYDIGIKPQAAGGRLIALQTGDFSHYARSKGRFVLHALDAYTGRLLWKHETGKFIRYATTAEAVYIVDDSDFVVLDAATGHEQLRKPIAEGAELVGRSILVDGDVVLIGGSSNRRGNVVGGLWESDTLLAFDRESGEKLWTKTASHRFTSQAIAMADGKVYLTDSVSPGEASAYKRRGGEDKEAPVKFEALDARTGETAWSADLAKPYKLYGESGWTALRANDDVVAYSAATNQVLVGFSGTLYAFRPATGEQLWKTQIVGGQPLILRPDSFVTQAGKAYGLKTGEALEGGKLFEIDGCNYATGSACLFLARNSTASFVDIQTGEQHQMRNIRSGCSNSYVAADGLLSIPNFAVGCICNYPMQCSVTLVHMEEAAGWQPQEAIKAALPSEN